MKKLILNAYAISIKDLEKILKKFPAFTSADLSQRAREEGAYECDYYNKGIYYTRNAVSNETSEVFYIFQHGELWHGDSCFESAGARVALQVIYNPKTSPATTCHLETKTAKIWNIKNQELHGEVTSKAPIVTFGKKKFVWLNKEECESGTAKTMELVSLELLSKSEPISKDGSHNDYGKATKSHDQYVDLVLEGCTEEERKMIVPVEMSKEDNYMDATPTFKSKEMLDWFYKISENPEEFLNLPTKIFRSRKMTEILHNTAIFAIANKLEKTNVSPNSVNDATEFIRKMHEKIEMEGKIVHELNAKETDCKPNKQTNKRNVNKGGEGK